MSTDAFARAVFPRLDAAEAAAEREQARARGYAAGHAEGFRTGRAAAAAAAAQAEAERSEREAERTRKVDMALAALQAAAAALSERMLSATAHTADRIVAQAVELAEVVLQAELSDAGASAAAALRRALAAADPDQIRVLRLEPHDLRVLEELDALPVGLAVTGDPTLQPGDAVAELEHGGWDARIGPALDRAREALRRDGT